MDLTPRTAAQLVAAGRIAYGALCMLAPRSAFGPAGKRAEPQMAWLGRAFGVRDVVLGAGTLAAVSAGADPARWTAVSAAADGLDIANALVHRKELGAAGVVGTLGLAVPATVAGVWAARGLHRDFVHG